MEQQVKEFLSKMRKDERERLVLQRAREALLAQKEPDKKMLALVEAELRKCGGM